MDWFWSWNSNTLATWCEEPTHWKRPWCWAKLKVGGEGDDRGRDGWMASPTQWTWVWVNSRSLSKLHGQGSLACCSPWGLQRVGHDWVTEMNRLYPRDSNSWVIKDGTMYLYLKHHCAKSLQYFLTLCDPIDSSLPSFSVHGILQARILEWVAISYSRGSSWSRGQIKPPSLLSPELSGVFFTPSAAWEASPQLTSICTVLDLPLKSTNIV